VLFGLKQSAGQLFYSERLIAARLIVDS
jgi:hypothetical protein